MDLLESQLTRALNSRMPTVTSTYTAGAGSATAAAPARAGRIASIDALRGLVMFAMIFVNDLADTPEGVVPPWMKHFHGKSGMTFVDMVFPAFLFIVGMSIPVALGGRLARGEPPWRTFIHVVTRTLSLLLIGILMVNETPSTARMGWSGTLWCALMYLSAILAFCDLSTGSKAPASGGRRKIFRNMTLILRAAGFAMLAWLALSFRGEDGHAIVSLQPFSIHTEWFGILGLIGWAYLMGGCVYLAFRNHRTALLGCAVLLMCLYPADHTGAFNGFWLSHYLGIGEMLGSHAAITLAGIILATILVTPDTASVHSRIRFAVLFIVGCVIAALLTHGLYGINKNEATPAWCLWACAITATLWLIFYLICDVQNISVVSRPLALAGQNVLLAYLMSELLPSAGELLHLDSGYEALAGTHLLSCVARSAGTGVVILCLATGLNRLGFRLKL
jgi:heparan-alpha-glucosaminide N-acetyltransferase